MYHGHNEEGHFWQGLENEAGGAYFGAISDSNLLAEPACHLKLSPCAISKAVKRTMKDNSIWNVHSFRTLIKTVKLKGVSFPTKYEGCYPLAAGNETNREIVATKLEKKVNSNCWR
ncbi:MAG: hypothetical protein LWX02_03035 [Deltaproteobacteria bacterium]|nr:hypothetical protein [Deltaproteobacteria bacterium]